MHLNNAMIIIKVVQNQTLMLLGRFLICSNRRMCSLTTKDSLTITLVVMILTLMHSMLHQQRLKACLMTKITCLR